MNPRAAVAVALVIVAGQSVAQDAGRSDGFGRALELPAHRALAEVRNRPGTRLAPFVTDGCSGGLSDIWRGMAAQFDGFSEKYGGAPLWEDCCVVHDRAYHNAGPDPDPLASFEARLAADHALEQCVIRNGQEMNAELSRSLSVTPATITRVYEGIAAAMYLAVRFGGGPCSGLPWRWGFGYPPCNIVARESD